MAEIELDGVRFSYGAKEGNPFCLRDVTLSVEKGEFVCVLGRSGCGKSTLLRLMAGLCLPEEGAVRIGGRPVKGPAEKCAMVFQSGSLFPWMTVRQNVAFCIRHTDRGMGARQAREQAELCLAAVGMEEDLDKYPCQLSGGMRQRAAIAGAFAADAEILLLDEPFSALDTRMRAGLRSLLEALWRGRDTKGKTVVLVTHDLDEALLLADRVVFMKRGGIAAELPVPAPRPREAGSASCAGTRERLSALFYEEDCI